MAFAVLINGEEVKTFDQQVIGVRVRTSSGEASAVGIGNVGAVEILVDTAGVPDPTRLDMVEALQAKARRDFWDEHEGEPTGPAVDLGNRDLGAKQDLVGILEGDTTVNYPEPPPEEPTPEEPLAEPAPEETPTEEGGMQL